MSRVSAPTEFDSTRLPRAQKPHPVTAPPLSWGDRWLRERVLAQLDHLQTGTLTIHEEGSMQRLGRPAPDGLSAEVTIRNPRLYRRLALEGSLGAAEAYLDGDWETNDLTAVVRILLRNAAALGALDQNSSWFMRLIDRGWHWLRSNSERGSRQNIAAHYDLGNEFFATFLDPTSAYSSAIYPHDDASLEEAQLHKFDRLCGLLELTPRDHLLEIGCGWGGLAVHAARNYGCRVTATTISQRQFEAAQERVRAAGLADRVQIVLQDYRRLTGQYDKLVSVEMIEAVGRAYLPAYFAACQRLLKPGGRCALQGITIIDQLDAAYCQSVDFIQKHIFPGGCLISLGAVSQAVAQGSRLRVTQWQDFGLHYARTLAEWRTRFHQNLPAIRAQGFDERFVRMWDYYFAYCEGGFREGQIGVAQIVLTS